MFYFNIIYIFIKREIDFDVLTSKSFNLINGVFMDK